MRFVEVEHPEVGRTTVPQTRLRHLREPWRPVDPAQAVGADRTVDEVLAEVGDDPNSARLALQAERTGRNRKTLIEQLTRIADNAQED